MFGNHCLPYDGSIHHNPDEVYAGERVGRDHNI